MTAILGISAFYHDSAAALVVDGEIVAAAQEERFTPQEARRRLSRARRSPTACDEAGLTPEQLDYVAFYDKPLTQVRAAAGDLPGLRARRASAASAWRCRVWLKEKLHLRADHPARRSAAADGAARLHSITTRATPPARSSPARSTRRRS